MSDAPAPAAPAASPAPAESQASPIIEDNNSEVESTEEVIEAAPPQPTTSKKKYQLKIDGKDEELELDFSNDDEVKKYLQKAKGFDKRSQEFAGYKTQVQQFLKKLQDDPSSLFSEIGMDPDEWAEKRLQQKLEQMAKSPEQLEREKMQQELEQLRREKEESAKAKEEAEQESILQKTASEIQNGIMKALDNTKSILPKDNPGVISEIAKAMKEAMKRGYNEVSVEDVIPLVEKRYKQQIQSLFNVLPEDSLEMMIGNQNLDRLRKRRVAKNMSNPAPTAKQVVKDTGASARPASEEKAEPKMSYSQFFKK